MSSFKILMAIGLIAVLAGTVQADLYVDFHCVGALINYDSATKTMNVTEDVGSIFDVYLADNKTATFLDSARIIGGANFNMDIALNLVQLGPENWTATGTLSFTDLTLSPVAADATFKATSIQLEPGTKFMTIQGLLTGFPILVNRGDPWTYIGNSEIISADADGVDNQITVQYPDNYKTGTLMTLRSAAPITSLDELFSQDRRLEAAEVKGTIIPAPAAAVLGLIGLSLIGVRMRKYA